MSDLALRPLHWRDTLWCQRLAADPLTRAMSSDPSLPTLVKHLRWMGRHIAHETAWVAIRPWEAWTYTHRRRGLAQVKRGPDGRLWIGVTVAPEWRGIRLATPLIEAATQRILRQWPNEQAVWANVKFGNDTSLRSFSRAGYVSWFVGRAVPQTTPGYWTLVYPRPENGRWAA